MVFQLAQETSLDNDQDQRDQVARKALCRSARALLALGKLDEADDVLKRLRASGEPNDKLEQQSLDLRNAAAARERTKAQDAKTRAEDELRLKVALRSRGLVLPSTWTFASALASCPHDVQPPHFDHESGPETLCFPVFVLRPLASPPTRDLILEWIENVPVSMQFDATGIDGLHDAYVTTAKGQLFKIGRKLALVDIFKAAAKPAEQDGLVLRDGWCLEIYAVPRDGATAWAEEMKRSLKA